jgi:hypothetical protein
VTAQYLKKFSYGFLDNQWFSSEPNISQIEAWSSSIYAWYQEFGFVCLFEFFFEFQTEVAKIKKYIRNIKIFNTLIFNF